MTSYMPDEMKTAQSRSARKLDVSKQGPTGTTWYLPVAGMQSAPGDYASGKGNWQKGSFGYQKPASKGGHVHEGTDIYAEEGTAIVAPVAGTVISVGNGAKSGNYVKIRGTDGIEYYFAHMQDSSPWSQGTRVQAGIFVGAVGKSGNASGTTPHLHFSMKKNGKAVNPNAFLETGRQQKHTPLSAIPGLNTPEEIANWAMEESKRQASARGAMEGFDAAGIAGRIQEQNAPPAEGVGQAFLGSTLDAFSRRVSGGNNRVQIPKLSKDERMSTAMNATDQQTGTGVATAEAEHPVSQREESSEVNNGG